MNDEAYVVVTLIKDVPNASAENPVELFVDYNYTTSKKMNAKRRAMAKRRQDVVNGEGGWMMRKTQLW